MVEDSAVVSFEPSPKVTNETSIRVASTLDEVKDGMVFVNIANPTPFPLTIQKDTPLGRVSPAFMPDSNWTFSTVTKSDKLPPATSMTDEEFLRQFPFDPELTAKQLAIIKRVLLDLGIDF